MLVLLLPHAAWCLGRCRGAEGQLGQIRVSVDSWQAECEITIASSRTKAVVFEFRILRTRNIAITGVGGKADCATRYKFDVED